MSFVFARPLSRRKPPLARAFDQSGSRPVPAIVNEVLESPGRSLEPAPRAYLGSRLHFDLSRVRIHTDEKAAESAQTIGSLAYAAGNHIVFGRGQYNPHTSAGLGLLAHELGHVAQQSGAASAHKGDLAIGDAAGEAEKNADQIAYAAAAGRNLPQVQSHRTQVMRATRTYALTFDDGPHAAELGKGINLTENVLDTLQAKSVKAGFFIQTGVSYRGANKVGQALVARMQKDGHTVGIHTGGKTDHELHTDAEKAGRLAGELESAKQYIKKQTGHTPAFVRPPTGKSDADVLKTYGKAGLTNLLWDVDGDEGKNHSLAELKTRIEKGINTLNTGGWKASTPAKPKFVFLYHDIQKGTANNLDAIIDHIKTTTSKVTKGADTADFAAP